MAMVVVQEPSPERLKGLTNLIQEELNVKELKITTQKNDLVDYEIHLLPEILGRKHGKIFPKLQARVQSMDVRTLTQRFQQGLDVRVEVENQIVTLLPDEVEVRMKAKTGFVITEEQNMIVGVNTIITDDLRQEGLAREIVRRVQNQRKMAGFHIDDKIELYYVAGINLSEVFDAFQDYIQTETLATLIRSKPTKESHVQEYEIGDESLTIGIVIKNTP
jgi:isoleucyl-tRNA synthetase